MNTFSYDYYNASFCMGIFIWKTFIEPICNCEFPQFVKIIFFFYSACSHVMYAVFDTDIQYIIHMNSYWWVAFSHWTTLHQEKLNNTNLLHVEFRNHGWIYSLKSTPPHPPTPPLRIGAEGSQWHVAGKHFVF